MFWWCSWAVWFWCITFSIMLHTIRVPWQFREIQSPGTNVSPITIVAGGEFTCYQYSCENNFVLSGFLILFLLSLSVCMFQILQLILQPLILTWFSTTFTNMLKEKGHSHALLHHLLPTLPQLNKFPTIWVSNKGLTYLHGLWWWKQIGIY